MCMKQLGQIIGYGMIAIGLGFAGIAITYGFLAGIQLFGQALST